jgi:hypothetical protein
MTPTDIINILARLKFPVLLYNAIAAALLGSTLMRTSSASGSRRVY